ncbi:MAG: PD-(D/E)XK nuclease family protein [Pseudomonadota bacterium]|nr:PD-(D/E)XK nuclease family protein [Pseudomonadota bacterium]
MLDELLTDLLARPSAELSAGAIVLPTQRLCLYCQAELARNTQALFTPLIATLDNFLTHLQDGIEQPIIANQHAEYIIATTLKNSSYQYLQPNFAREINLLFQEITHSTVAGIGLANRLNATINTDNETFLLRQQKIHAELEQLYLTLHKQLTADKQTTSYFALQAQVNSLNIAEKLQSFAFIHVMPLLNPSRLQATVLNMIAKHAKTFNYQSTKQQPPTQVITMPSANAEVHYALNQIKKLLKDKQCSPAEIAMVIPDSATYLPALLAQKTSIPISLHIPVPLRMTSIGLFLQMLCDYQTDKDRALLDLLHSPHTAKILPKNFSYDKHQLAHAFTQTDRAVVEDYAAYIDTYLRGYSQGNRFAHLAQLIAKLEFLDDERFDSKHIENLLKSLRFIQNSHVSKLHISAHDFWRFVADRFLQLPLPIEDALLAGVQVISLNDACSMHFTHVYVLGCVQRKFPHPTTDDFILSNRARKHIGLPDWSDIEALAQEKFKLLTSNAANLHLYYPSNQVPAQCLGKTTRSLTTADVYQFSAVSATVNHTASYQPHDLGITRLTAYSLESFMRCPMRYLLQRANVEPLQLPEYPSPLVEGSRLHQTITELVGSEAYQRIKRHHPQTEREQLLTQALCQTASSLLPQDSITAINQHFFGWRRLAKFLLMLEGKDIVAEIKHSSSINVAQQTIELVGKFDHTIIDGDFVWLLEYKRSTIPNKAEVAAIISPQLLLYAFLSQQIARTIIVYFSLLKGELAVVAAGSEALVHVQERFGKRIKLHSLEELVERMLAKISSRYDEIERHGFFADPTPKGCSNCDYAGICRKEHATKWAKV